MVSLRKEERALVRLTNAGERPTLWIALSGHNTLGRAPGPSGRGGFRLRGL